MSLYKIRFVNFERSPALETFTEKSIAGILHRLEQRPGNNKSVEIQFRLDAKAPLGSIKNNEVKISYKYPGIKKVFHVKKTGSDLREVLKDAIHATETLIRRATEKSESGRRTLGKSKKHVKSLRS